MGARVGFIRIGEKLLKRKKKSLGRIEMRLKGQKKKCFISLSIFRT